MKKLVLISLILFCLCAFTMAYGEGTKRSASVLEFKGAVEVKMANKSWVPAKTGMILSQGDIIRTKKNAYCVLNLDGNGETATVELKENSQMNLAKLLADKEASSQVTLLDLSLGEILIKAKKLHSEKSRFEVKTPTSIVGVRGTTFSVTVATAE